MADCARHPESASVLVGGVKHCEACLAERLQGPPRTSGLPNPTVAAVLGLLPGAGAFYNGQYEKGIVHVLLFPLLIAMTDASNGFLGVLIPAYFVYLFADAYKTALAMRQGTARPDYLALGPLFGDSERPLSAAFGRVREAPPGPAGGSAAAVLDAEAPPKPPLAAMVLIVLGVLLLCGNLGWLPRDLFHEFWPVVLIVIGILQARRRLAGRQ
jgi:hypothetical protein